MCWQNSTIGQRLFRLGAVGFFVFCLSFSLSAQLSILFARTVKETQAQPTPSAQPTKDEQIKSLTMQNQALTLEVKKWILWFKTLKPAEQDFLTRLEQVTSYWQNQKSLWEAERSASAGAIQQRDAQISQLTTERDNALRDAKLGPLWASLGAGGGGILGYLLGHNLK